MKVTVIDVKKEVEYTVGMLRGHPGFGDDLPVKVCVGLENDELSIVFGPDDDSDAHVHDTLLYTAIGCKPSTRGGGKINLRNQDSQVVASWTRNKSASLGPIPDELKETVMQELQPFLKA